MQKRIPRRGAAALGLALALALLLSGCRSASGPRASGASPAVSSSSAVSSSGVSSSSGAPSSSAPGGSSSSAPGAASPRASSGGASSGAPSSSGTPQSSAPAGRSGASAVSSSAPAAQTVTLTIDATRGDDGMVASGVRVPLQSGDSVYSVLARTCKAEKILLAARNTAYGEYVSAIDGVAEFDKGGSSGWTYRVNGTYPDYSCDKYKPKPGDKIEWIYTTDGKNP